MSKNTSIYLDDFFQNFIDNQIRSGKFSSAIEVIRAALRLFEQQEQKAKIVVSELKNGKTIEELTKKMKCYSYYHEVYTAILGEYLGNYTEKNSQEEK